jgi:hypothetical protein
VFEKDPFIMIVKDAYFGEGDDDGYIFFEGFGCDDPPTLKGGEYDKKSFTIIDSNKKFYFEFTDQMTLQIKYKDNMDIDNLIKFLRTDDS